MKRLLTLALLSLVTIVHAEVIWETGKYTPADWTANPLNLLDDATCVYTNISYYIEQGGQKSSPAGLADGEVPGAKCDYSKIVGVRGGSAIWALAKSAVVKEVVIYSRWGDGGRDGINITQISLSSDGVNWTKVGGSVSYGNGNNSSGGALYARLYDTGDVALMNDVAQIKVEFSNNQDNAGSGYVEIEVIKGDIDQPEVTVGTVTTTAGGDVTVPFVLTRGKADISVQAVDSDSEVTSISVGTGISASETELSGTLTGLTPGKSYALNIHAVTEAESVFDFDAGTVYLGELSIAAGDNADAATLSPGSFVITRPSDDEATRLPLEVQYTCSGATAGTHYVELSGTVTIPAGAASTTVKVWPMLSGIGDHDLTLTLTSGLRHFVGTASATITILGSETVQPIRFVSLTGNDENDGLSPATAFRTIEHAIGEVESLEAATIMVYPGVYQTTSKISHTASMSPSHYVITNAITVVGIGDKPEDTHLKGSGNSNNKGRVFYLNHADAKVKNLLVSGGRAGDCTSIDGGGNIYIAALGGTVEDCVISNGYCTSWREGGGGIQMKTGRVVRTTFTCNAANNQNYGYVGAHLYQSGGYVENCLFTKCDGLETTSFALIQLDGSAVMSSCTIAGNHSKENASVYLVGTKCRVYNCAIFGNSVDTDSTGHASVYTLSGASVNQFVNCAADRELGDTCIYSASAGFVDEATYDFHLAGTSVCRDAGDETLYVAPQAISPTDLDGNLRLTGTKRGTTLDIGCYEFDASGLSVDATVDEPVGLMEYDGGLKPVTASFHAVKSGGSGAITYYWDFNGDGTTDLSTSEEDVTHEYTAIGVYTVILKATDDSGSASITKTALYSAGPKTIYVDADSANPTAPYVTRSTAAKTVSAAYDAAYDGTTIYLKPGIYPYSAQNKRLDISKAVTILGEGDAPTDVALTNDLYTTNNLGTATFFRMLDDGASIANMMFANGLDYSYQNGGGITVNAGIVSNCVLRGCGSRGGAGGILISGGLFTHSVVEECYITGHSGFQGAHIQGTGRIENTLFRNMRSNSSIVCVHGTGASLRNSTVVDCSVTYYESNPIDGKPERVDGAGITIINGNYNSSPIQGGYVYNTAVANVSRRAYQSHYKLQYVGTVITNMLPATNCANWNITYVYNNWHYPDADKHFQHCATEDATPINNTCCTGTAATFFRDYAQGDYRPKVKGPLYDKGLTLSGQESGTDLSGKPRVFGKGVDIGCLESQAGCGMCVIVR